MSVHLILACAYCFAPSLGYPSFFLPFSHLFITFFLSLLSFLKSKFKWYSAGTQVIPVKYHNFFLKKNLKKLLQWFFFLLLLLLLLWFFSLCLPLTWIIFFLRKDGWWASIHTLDSHQTHLAWAQGQPGKKKETGQYFNSTLIILFSEMLKFSKIIFSKSKNILWRITVNI